MAPYEIKKMTWHLVHLRNAPRKAIKYSNHFNPAEVRSTDLPCTLDICNTARIFTHESSSTCVIRRKAFLILGCIDLLSCIPPPTTLLSTIFGWGAGSCHIPFPYTVSVMHKVYKRSYILISHYLRENPMRYTNVFSIGGLLVLTSMLHISGCDALIVSRTESTCLVYHRILQQKGVCSRDAYGTTDDCACLLDKIKCYPHSKCTRNQFLRDRIFCDMPLDTGIFYDNCALLHDHDNTMNNTEDVLAWIFFIILSLGLLAYVIQVVYTRDFRDGMTILDTGPLIVLEFLFFLLFWFWFGELYAWINLLIFLFLYTILIVFGFLIDLRQDQNFDEKKHRMLRHPCPECATLASTHVVPTNTEIIPIASPAKNTN